MESQMNYSFPHKINDPQDNQVKQYLSFVINCTDSHQVIKKYIEEELYDKPSIIIMIKKILKNYSEPQRLKETQSFVAVCLSVGMNQGDINDYNNFIIRHPDFQSQIPGVIDSNLIIQ
jgi:hypothetical protein